MKTVEKVEVFSDMTFYIIDSINGKLHWKTLYTGTLYSLIDTLKEIKEMSKDATLIACCYKQYEGSFNVIVDPVKQYENLYNYALKEYKTFPSKVEEENLPGTIVLMDNTTYLTDKLNEVDANLEDLHNILIGETDQEFIDKVNNRITDKLYLRNDILKQLNDDKNKL